MTGGKKQTRQKNMSGGTTEVNNILGRALWPRETPKMMVVDGDILLAAAACPPPAVIENLFKTLLRVRQAEFEAQEEVNNPDAWDTSAAEPGVAIDLDRQLDGTEFGSAYARWRQQCQDHVASLARGTPDTSA